MTNKTALLTPLSLATAATLAAILTPASAMALTFNWSFVAGSGSSGQVGQTISGTISGLVEGANDGTGLTITVDSTPTGEFLGGGWRFGAVLEGDAFTVTGGAVTFADVLYFRNTEVKENLPFGGVERLSFGGFGGYYRPQLVDLPDFDHNWVNFSAPNTFTLANTAPVPEPLTILGVGTALGFGAAFKRKLAQKKDQDKA